MRLRTWRLSFLLACAAVAAVAQERVSLDTLVDRGLAEATGTPSYTWLADGTAVLHDRRVPAAQRTLERLDPASGQRTPLLDPRGVLEGWARVLGEGEKAPPSLPWPAEIHPSGRVALYEHLGDLFLVDLPGGGVRRL
ncbi:MAG: hypothetical protein HRF46_02960, partial [Acidobacteriota bacterium]